MSTSGVPAIRSDALPQPHRKEQRGCIATLAITLFVVGLLLVIGATVMVTQHVNAIATYTTGGLGVALILAAIMKGALQCMRMRGEAESPASLDRRASTEETAPIEEPGAKAHRDSSPFKDFETKWHGSPHSALKGQDGGLAQVQTIPSALTEEQKVESLFRAISSGQIEVVRNLIAAHVDPLSVSNEPSRNPSLRWPAIFCVFVHLNAQSLEILRIMLDKQPLLISHPSPFQNYTLLHHAVSLREIKKELQCIQLNIVKYLVTEKRAEVNAPDQEGNTPLHLVVHYPLPAPINPSLNLIELLVAHGANWDMRNTAGVTPRTSLMENRNLSYWRKEPAVQPRLTAMGLI